MRDANNYNGWTDYATWRINLEMLEGYETSTRDTYDLSKELKEYCEGFIEDTTPDGLARDYALAFMDDVNWYEIAEHIIADMEPEEEEKETTEE